MKKVLGLDIGSNSIGYALLELSEDNNQILFKDLASNSIVFSEPTKAKDRRDFRSGRRKNQRKSARNKSARKVFTLFGITKDDFISNPTDYLNSLNLSIRDVYELRENAVNGTSLSKDEFALAVYSILTDRGYTNMFSLEEVTSEKTPAQKAQKEEDEKVNSAISKNKQKYFSSQYKIPSQIVTQKRKELDELYQNIAVRNKKGDYSNSLDRELHKEEFRKVVSSQENNKDIFNSKEECYKFIETILDENKANMPFHQRPLKSFEDMVEYCTYYNKYNPIAQEKRVPLANIKYIEFVIRQKIENYQIIDNKTGEVKSLSKEDIKKIVDFWINTPPKLNINAGNIFKDAGFKDIKLAIPEKSSQVVLDISAHKNILEVLQKHSIDFRDSHNLFYNGLLLELYYHKNKTSRVKHISKLIEKYRLDLEDAFLDEVVSLSGMDGFGSFSLRFINEILETMNNQNKTYYEATQILNYNAKYLNMPIYDYLPPLEPTNADIQWLEKNVAGFKKEHLFYQPMLSPKVKRVIGVLRKLVNELIRKYGKIDEIRIETAKTLNTKKEEDKITKNQDNDKKKNDEAKKLLKSKNIFESKNNIDRAKLFKEQGGFCLYSGEIITEDEAFDENETEVEHFIPRSVIWINSYKNKILVKKKYNQNKGSSHPVQYLKSIGQWEEFCGRVKQNFMDSKKKDWLSKEDVINSVMEKEHWQDSFLNDTRVATRVISKYLNHYLYPKENLHGKGEQRYIYSVSGRAISELKYIWGISDVMPKKEDDKKDRDTNYHHTLDAFIVALCGNRAINSLHSFFKKKENKFKAKAQKDNISLNVPILEDGKGVVAYLKDMVERYETNKLYVCPYNKRKINIRGFKDGNLKLYVAQDPKDENKEILAEMDKVSIDSKILLTDGNFPKDRNDKEVIEWLENTKARLDTQKQKKIIEALDVYVNSLLEIRNNIKIIEGQIKDVEGEIKQSKTKEDENVLLKENLAELKNSKKKLIAEKENLRCSYKVKNGKQQIVRTLRLYKIKSSKVEMGSLIFPRSTLNKIEDLSVENFKKALDKKEPFVVKKNGFTVSVDLYKNHKGKQIVGLNSFSSLKNDIGIKANEKLLKEIDSTKVTPLTLYKNDIIQTLDTTTGNKNYFIFNGGGNIAGTNNKILIKNINNSFFVKKDKKGNLNLIKEDSITPGEKLIVSKADIDFFGSISEI